MTTDDEGVNQDGERSPDRPPRTEKVWAVALAALPFALGAGLRGHRSVDRDGVDVVDMAVFAMAAIASLWLASALVKGAGGRSGWVLLALAPVLTIGGWTIGAFGWPWGWAWSPIAWACLAVGGVLSAIAWHTFRPSRPEWWSVCFAGIFFLFWPRNGLVLDAIARSWEMLCWDRGDMEAAEGQWDLFSARWADFQLELLVGAVCGGIACAVLVATMLRLVRVKDARGRLLCALPLSAFVLSSGVRDVVSLPTGWPLGLPPADELTAATFEMPGVADQALGHASMILAGLASAVAAFALSAFRGGQTTRAAVVLAAVTTSAILMWGAAEAELEARLARRGEAFVLDRGHPPAVESHSGEEGPCWEDPGSLGSGSSAGWVVRAALRPEVLAALLGALVGSLAGLIVGRRRAAAEPTRSWRLRMLAVVLAIGAAPILVALGGWVYALSP